MTDRSSSPSDGQDIGLVSILIAIGALIVAMFAIFNANGGGGALAPDTTSDPAVPDWQDVVTADIVPRA